MQLKKQCVKIWIHSWKKGRSQLEGSGSDREIPGSKPVICIFY